MSCLWVFGEGKSEWEGGSQGVYKNDGGRTSGRYFRREVRMEGFLGQEGT